MLQVSWKEEGVEGGIKLKTLNGRKEGEERQGGGMGSYQIGGEKYPYSGKIRQPKGGGAAQSPFSMYYFTLNHAISSLLDRQMLFSMHLVGKYQGQNWSLFFGSAFFSLQNMGGRDLVSQQGNCFQKLFSFLQFFLKIWSQICLCLSARSMAFRS